jgi:class 3 adenylate cyclase
MPVSNVGVYKLTDSLEELSNSKDLYVLFVDMCDSTEFKNYCKQNDIPDSVWIQRQLFFLERCSLIIRNYKGDIIKTIGDEVMATFPISIDPINIIYCIIEVFGGFSNIKAYNKGKFIIKSKASIDFGECYNGSVFTNKVFDPIGTCVDRCARISKNISADEIVFSKDYFNLIDKKINTIGLQIISRQEELKGLGVVDFYIAKP